MKHLRVLFVVLLLVSCSKVQYLYNQIDWILPLYIESYFDFTDSQHTSLKREVKLLLKWHCSTQLSLYSTLLTRANADFQARRITYEKLEFYASTLDIYWANIVHEASPGIAQILVTMNQHQVQQLFDSFLEKNLEVENEYKKRSTEERSRDYKTRMIDELERWFGSLTPDQKQAAIDWSRTFRSLGKVGLDNRRQWQTALRSLLEQRNELPEFTTGVIKLFSNREILRSKAYQNRLDHNRRATIELLYRVSNLLNNTQRIHLDKELTAIIKDFDTLSCLPETAQR